MKTEPGMNRSQADDEELRGRMAEVLKSELLGSRGKRVQDVGRLCR
jgi:hypothetical protein